MEAEARAAPVKNRFDQSDRDRVRRALLRYMQEHAIGVPTLQKQIAAANDLGLDRIPLKTLQRFLGDTHRSNDAMVRFCDRFASGFPETDQLAAFGEQMVGFLGVWREGNNCRPLPADFAGPFDGSAEIAPPPGKIRAYTDSAADRAPFSRLEIEILPQRPFAAVRETVTNWRRSAIPPSNEGETTPRRSYEGVALYPNNCLFVLMRNILTGAPRLYWLGRFADHPLAGHGHEAIDSLDDRPALNSGLYSTVSVTFARPGG